MINVWKLKCLDTITVGNVTFIKGNIYLGRKSLSGKRNLILSDDNVWVDFTRPVYVGSLDGVTGNIQVVYFESCFKVVETVMVQNKSELRQLNNS